MKTRRHITTLGVILILALSIRMQIQSGSTSTTINLQGIETNQTGLVIPLITDSNIVIDGTISENEYGESFTESESGIIVYWEHNGIDLNVGLISPGTGWISIGIGAIGVGSFMQDSNMIFGGLNDTSPYCFDLIGLTGHMLENDTDNGGSYNVNSFAVTEVTTTILEFQIPLDSGDPLDPILEEGLESIFFFAYHPDEDTMKISFHEAGTRSTRKISVMIEAEALDLDDFDRSIPLVQDSNVLVDGDISNNEYSSSFTDPLTGMDVYWEHNLAEFKIGLVAPGTGWVALGIGPNMQESTMYMGGVANGETYCIDLDGLEDWLHEEDETNDISDCVASETDDVTTLEFTIPLNVSDTLDTVLEVQKVYEMFLGYHQSSDDRMQIHTGHSDVFKVLLMPEAQSIETFMSFESETEVSFNETINFEIQLSDENGSIADIPIVFYMDSQFGEVILTTTLTDENGKANTSYSNPYLLHEHTFGARSLEVVIVESGEVFAYESSDVKQEIMFNEKIEHDQRAENIRLTRIGLLAAFWVVGIIIWGGFGFTFYQMYQIFKGRNEEIEGIMTSEKDVQAEGGNEE